MSTDRKGRLRPGGRHLVIRVFLLGFVAAVGAGVLAHAAYDALLHSRTVLALAAIPLIIILWRRAIGLTRCAGGGRPSPGTRHRITDPRREASRLTPGPRKCFT